MIRKVLRRDPKTGQPIQSEPLSDTEANIEKSKEMDYLKDEGDLDAEIGQFNPAQQEGDQKTPESRHFLRERAIERIRRGEFGARDSSGEPRSYTGKTGGALAKGVAQELTGRPLRGVGS